MKHVNFVLAINAAEERLLNHSVLVHTERWQGVDISQKPEMATHEIRHHFMRVTLNGREDVLFYQRQIKPNLPWADDHFAERVCGHPINPGETWKTWPWARNATKFLDAEGQFNHNYMERYWPKYAGMIGPTATGEEFKHRLLSMYGDTFIETQSNRGIDVSVPLGDLADVVKQLAREPMTRQAILPVFFPEDTGAMHGGRVPCSLAYQFMMRDNKLDVSYWLRSCDFTRHFRDDIYLTCRLMLWVLDELRKLDPKWNDVHPGEYVMLISSLHCFRNDFKQLQENAR